MLCAVAALMVGCSSGVTPSTGATSTPGTTPVTSPGQSATATGTPAPTSGDTGSPGPSDSSIPSPSPSPVDTTPRATITAKPNGLVRTGDSTDYPVLTALPKGTVVKIVGISSTGSGWYEVNTPHDGKGWIGPAVVSTSGDLSHLKKVTPPPLPTATPTPTPTATPTASPTASPT